MGRKRDARNGIISRDLDRVMRAVDSARRLDRLEWQTSVPDKRGRFTIRYTAQTVGACLNPLPLYFRGAPKNWRFPGQTKGVLLEQRVPCRKCSWCRSMRAREWGDRAEYEHGRNMVTWFGTIELSPQEHALADMLRDQETGGDPSAVFLARARWMGEQVQSWFEKVREKRRRDLGRSPEVKYLLAVEQHKGTRSPTPRAERSEPEGRPLGRLDGEGIGPRSLRGFPHFHMLLHEWKVGELVREYEYYRTKKGEVRVADESLLRTAWPFEGFTQFKRLNADEGWRCRYLCKYLAKDEVEDWRVRASKGYGPEDDEEATAVRSDVLVFSPDSGREERTC